MFKPLFATMHEVLTEIMSEYSTASGARKQLLDEQLLALKAMSDSCIEEWLRFEEKLGRLLPLANQGKIPVKAKIKGKAAKEEGFPVDPSNQSGFEEAQGYYKLSMFEVAAPKLDEMVRKQPDFVLGRFYLALCHFHLGDLAEAYREFKILLALTENRKLKAISYTGMGCVHYEHNNLEKAMEYFRMAFEEDPECIELSLAYGSELRW
ncbi:putative PEP-CTERM system TPR-repeat lipoprotein [Chlamydia abortus]|uniref:Tetratricopeptide repeat protein n=1 Tax=Paenibacillus residui TaxID=629724 RepID=A0ABW3D382_9BACL|nr:MULTISPECIES: tetratricopeptide repeat protein [Paenibacillaceae]SHE10993.1 putative PEP-CTERM system TPR-repeat lipoprotein [Chlamydia abortus]